MKNVILTVLRFTTVSALGLAAVGLTSCKSSDPAYSTAMRALYGKGVPKEKLGRVAVVDFTQPSTKKRLTIYEPDGKKSSSYLVAHGYGSGTKYAESFSDRSGSGQSSLGLYQIGSPYYGKHGKSLKLHGLESGVNGSAFSRAIVLHSADYVSDKAKWDNFKAGEGWRIGRSAGCPAVSEEDIQEVLQKLPTGSFLYIYAGQQVLLPTIPTASIDMLAADSDGQSEGGVAVEASGTKRERIQVQPR